MQVSFVSYNYNNQSFLFAANLLLLTPCNLYHIYVICCLRFVCMIRWPKWAIAKVFSKSRKKFSYKEESFQNQEHAHTIKNTRTRSRTRKYDQKHVTGRSKFLFQDREKIFEDKKELTQLTIKENYKYDHNYEMN